MKAIFFDFDGTLANTADGIAATCAETLRRMNCPVPQEDEVRKLIGLPLKETLQQLGGLDGQAAEEATLLYKKLFPHFEALLVTIFPHVDCTLAQLRQRGIRLAVCTSRDLHSLRLIMDKNGLTQHFDILATADDNLNPKPAPDMVEHLLEKMQLDAKDVWVVGDTTFDIDMGNGAGCHTVAVAYGNHSVEQLLASRPTKMVWDIRELLELV